MMPQTNNNTASKFTISTRPRTNHCLFRNTKAPLQQWCFMFISVMLPSRWIIRQLACFSLSSNVICAQHWSLCRCTVGMCVCVCVSAECIDMHKCRHAEPHKHFRAHQGTQTNTLPPNTTTNSLPFALQEMVFNMAVPRVLPGWHNVTVWPSLNVSGPKTTSHPCHIPRQDQSAASSKLSLGELWNLSASALS